jgi:hypothetical protein
MMLDIFQYLSSDSELASALDHVFPTQNKIGVGRANNVEDYPYIIFNAFPYSKTLVNKEYRIKITIATQLENELDSISTRLIDLLDTGNKPIFKLNDKVIHNSRLMTGGSLIFHEDQKVYEQIMYFHMKVK